MGVRRGVRLARGRSRLAAALVAVATMLGGLVAVAVLSAPAARATSTHNTALINGDSVKPLASIVDGGSPISLEQFAAQQAGYTVTVVSGVAWDAMTAADFAKYQLLIVGDPSCSQTPASATSNAATWAPVVMGKSANTLVGNRVVVGTDPVFHYQFGSGGSQPTNPADPTTSGAEHLVQDGIAYAGAVAGATGVYFDTSCTDGGSNVAVLNSLSGAGTGFSENIGPPCGSSVGVIASTAAFASLSDSDIEGWACSVHITFPTYPTDWQPVVVATDTATHPTCGTSQTTHTTVCGQSYVLAAGRGIVVNSPDIKLTPAGASNPAGTPHTVTATVTQGASPVSGALVSFMVTGQNQGVHGTCVPAACTTNASGKVTFTYTGVHGVGTDTINASVTISGTTEHATATKTWTTPPPTTTTTAPPTTTTAKPTTTTTVPSHATTCIGHSGAIDNILLNNGVAGPGLLLAKKYPQQLKLSASGQTCGGGIVKTARAKMKITTATAVNCRTLPKTSTQAGVKLGGSGTFTWTAPPGMGTSNFNVQWLWISNKKIHFSGSVSAGGSASNVFRGKHVSGNITTHQSLAPVAAGGNCTATVPLKHFDVTGLSYTLS